MSYTTSYTSSNGQPSNAITRLDEVSHLARYFEENDETLTAQIVANHLNQE